MSQGKTRTGGMLDEIIREEMGRVVSRQGETYHVKMKAITRSNGTGRGKIDEGWP